MRSMPSIPSASDEQTPLMKQYWELKAQVPDSLLLFRMGDFYELFADDAVEASRILEITLTSRDRNKENPMPMAGVPWHSVAGYIQRLLKAGKKIAIGEQLEPEPGEKIVRRKIVRQFTPGVQFDVEGSEANYIAAVLPQAGKTNKAPHSWLLACLDASTGECLVSGNLTSEQLAQDLESLPIRHILKLGDFALPLLSVQGSENSKILVEMLPSNYLSETQAAEILNRHYGMQCLDGSYPLHALGIVVNYAMRTQQREVLSHLRLPTPLHRPQTMVLGPRTAQHLDLLPQTNDSTPNLFTLINHTKCALGARCLRRWLLAPLKKPESILDRQEAVIEISAHSCSSGEKLAQSLSEVYDLERIMGRINTGLAGPRDTLGLGKSLGVLTRLEQNLNGSKAKALVETRSALRALREDLHALSERILSTQREEAPLSTRDGGIFKIGTHSELDRLINLNEDGQRWLIDLETREREATGISNLKIRFNRVFGYYIEITQAHVKSAPAHYQRKQTTVGAERFFTEELKKFEDEIVNASSRQKSLEQDLFGELLRAIQEKTPSIMEAAKHLGELDSLVSLSKLSLESGWSFPTIDDSLELEIVQGRHPIVDQASRGSFVPNDLSLSPETRLTLMITGPNMGGKSTIMRQTALIVLLGQMGAPVPAKSARWGSVSSLYTRIGAHDAIARGQSTFMVEMTELAHILHHADERSLIVLDEIGRGTSTYDGISVAWATLEHIAGHIRARALFATHYHELTRLAGPGSGIPGLANAHMAVESQGNTSNSEFRFLYLLKEGPANESFGIHVARLAGIPKNVVSRAWKVLEELEQSQASYAERVQARDINQLSLFSAVSVPEARKVPEVLEVSETWAHHPVLSEIDRLDPNQMTPLEALNWLAKLQEMSRESASKLS
jgi:DNA mismatch repair protein MutS